MELDIGKLTNEGEGLLRDFVQKMGLEGGLIATAEGLEMASFFTGNQEVDIIAADMASLLSSTHSVLTDSDKGKLSEMIITSDQGAVAIKDLGEDVVFGVLAPANYKMGGLVVALKKFVSELQAL